MPAAFHPTLRKLLENTKAAADATPPPLRVVTREELERHNGQDGAVGSWWVAVCSHVYDLEAFFDGSKKHPGGSKILNKHLGKDATGIFMNFHYPRGTAVKMAPSMLVGVLEKAPDDGIAEEDSEEEGY